MPRLEKLLYKFNNDLNIGESIEINIDINKDNIGYLVYSGFKINYFIKNYNNEYTVKLTKKEHFSDLKKRKYSWFIKLPRTGKNGKIFYVYKFRTMQPYAEYIQSLVVEKNGLNDNGTIKDDFRITKVGKFLRKYWIDELPMLVNFVKGDLKLMGVRPLSDTMLAKYPQDFVKIRNMYKPGLIPPYYIDNPDSFEGLIESEKRYLAEYNKKGFITDIKYFFLFLRAIFLRGVRSS